MELCGAISLTDVESEKQVANDTYSLIDIKFENKQNPVMFMDAGSPGNQGRAWVEIPGKRGPLPSVV